MSRSDSATSPAPRLANGARSWQLADVIDFEFLLEQDRERPLAALEARDHIIAQQLAVDDQNSFKDARRLFRGWLEFRRTEAPQSPLPGETATAAWRVLLKMVTVVALVLGSATAINLLRYDGTQPVNVATYLGWLVLVQIGLVAVAFGAVLLRRTGWMSTETSLLTGLMRWGWSALAVRLNRHLLNRIPAERRTAVESFLGTSSTFKQLYGGVAIWPLVGALQWFGVCFNLAALATTVALVVFSDRAFGWQSAVNFSPEQIHQLTQTLAAPWSGIVPAAGAPTLEQVAGSKILLKDGIRQLATENLVSWWPFLVAALGFYGLLPRVVLYILAFAMGRRSLRALIFNHVSCDRLYERLTTQRMRSQAIGAEAARTDLPVESTTQSGGPSASASITAAQNEAVILMSADVRKHLDQAAFAHQLGSRLNLRPVAWLDWSEASNIRSAALEKLAGMKRPTNQLGSFSSKKPGSRRSPKSSMACARYANLPAPRQS